MCDDYKRFRLKLVSSQYQWKGVPANKRFIIRQLRKISCHPIKMRSSIVVTSLCAVFVLVLLSSQDGVHSTPIKYSNWKEYLEATGRKLTYTENGENKCTHGGNVRDLCEKCAKFTKNEVVFPLCCEDQDNVRKWCKEFLEYSPDPSLS